MFKLGRRSKDSISIQIETNSIKFALGNYKKDALIVDKLLSVPLEDNVFKNGMPVDEAALKSAIEMGIKQLNTKAKDVLLSIESSEILKREIQVPKVEEANLKDLIRFEVSQYLPIDVDDYVLQYQIISTEVEEEVEKLNVLIVAMPKDMAMYYFNLLEGLKLNPVGMDISGNNAVKLIKFSMNDALISNTTAMIDISYSNLEIIILENSLNKLNRLVGRGPYDMDKEIADALHIPFKAAHDMVHGYLQVGVSDLLAAHQAYSDLKEQRQHIDGVSVADLNRNASKKMHAISLIIEHVGDIYDEIEKVFKYYTFKERGNKIDKILLYGEYAKYDSLASIFEERFNIATDVIDNEKLHRVTVKSNKDNVNMYVGAIGGLIRK